MPRDDAIRARLPRQTGSRRSAERPLRVLLLAGTIEARQIAAHLAREAGVLTRASLARAERRPIPLGVPIRIGGWGGRAPFADWLDRERIGAVIDATHPFASRMSHRAAEVTDDLGIDHLQFLRPAWRPGQGDRWTFLTDAADAARHIAPDARVYLVTGRQGLPDFAPLAGRTVHCHLLDTPTDPFPFGTGGYVGARLAGTATVEDEIATLSRLGVDWLVVHNTGGAEGHARLIAARTLGLRVAMLRRPAQPEGVARCETLSEVVAWVRRRL